MELLVKVYAENTETGLIKLANEAFFTFVALDKNSKSCSVPELVPQTDDEKSLLEEAAIRRETRLKLKGNS